MILPDELEEVAFLRELGERYFNQLAQIAHLKEFRRGSVIFHEGQEAPFIYFILSGKVSLEVIEPGYGAIEVETLGPGELLGWSPALGGHAMTATAIALTRGRLAALDATRVLALCEEEPRFGVAFLRQVGLIVSERLRCTRRTLAAVRSRAARSLA